MQKADHKSVIFAVAGNKNLRGNPLQSLCVATVSYNTSSLHSVTTLTHTITTSHSLFPWRKTFYSKVKVTLQRKNCARF